MYDSYKEGAVGMVGKKIKRRRGDDDDFSGDDSGGSFSDDDDDRATRGAKRASKSASNKKPVAKKTDAWLDRDLKALEDALVSFGSGVDGRCVRATVAALEAM